MIMLTLLNLFWFFKPLFLGDDRNIAEVYVGGKKLQLWDCPDGKEIK